MILNLRETLGSETALTPDAGSPVFDLISEAVKHKQQIKLDFTGMKVMSSAFLNVAIGQLYNIFGSDDLNAYLKILNIAEEDRVLLRLVINRAKDYFKDQKSFDDRINRLYEDD